ncbi:MAG: cobalt transport protein [Deltaproteobacteria bacterium]|nr:cobalt transport protein [Deltaproteobacteria bacterium]
MPLFLYIERSTFVHRLHPVVKVFGMLCLFVAAFLSQRPSVMLPLTAAIGAVIVLIGVQRNVWRLRLLFVMVFVMTFVIWSLFFGAGTPVFSLGPVRISAAAVQFALGMALKLDTFLAIGVLFLSTTRIEEFAYALTRCGMPYKLGFTMTLAFRLVPVFLDAAITVVQAQRCRGFDFDRGNVAQRMRRYVPVIVPVFIGALRRADGMAMALEARGFQSGIPRTNFERFPFRAQDAAAALMLGAIAVLYVLLWFAGYATVPVA